jgi:hypothetical protein
MKAASTIFIVILFCLIVACGNNKTEVIEEFYADGTIKSETQVKDGLRNGLSKNYDEKGRLVSSAEFVNDVYEGWMLNYNPENGKITAKALYKNNNQDGPAILNYTDGSLYREMFYVDGRVDSIVRTYWADGKLQAEVYFRKGNPAIGLKEFDKKGNPVQQPTLVIKEINQLALLNRIQLIVSLSDGSQKVDYYAGDLVDEKYFSDNLIKMKDKDGVATMDFVVERGRTLMKEVSVIARKRTEFGNTLLLHKSYKLSAKN